LYAVNRNFGSLKILEVAAEAVPFAKVGHVAEVVGSLPVALRELGHDVRLVMPRYGKINPIKFDLKPLVSNLSIPLKNNKPEKVAILETIHPNSADLPVYFVDNHKYFDRDGIYSYPDDDERFILFCRAVLEMLPEIGWKPDIIHCHDWHTAIIPKWLETLYTKNDFYKGIASVYTIHNLAYQGIFGYRVLEIAGIAEQNFEYSRRDEFSSVVSMMSMGIRHADAVSTVSPTYAQEILTPQYGEHMENLLRTRKNQLFGILNGIDTKTFDPTSDPFLSANFGVDSLNKRIENKLALQKDCRLPQQVDVPLIGMISRLANQKGFDLLTQIIEPLLKLEVQFVLMGTGDPLYHEKFSQVAQLHPDKMSVNLTFNASLGQKIYGGSDLFLMPSRSEPCGLGQMIAMRYGAIPVVRQTGGLADTVQDFDPRTGAGNGFTFVEYDAWSFYTAIVRAVETYKYKAVWQNLMTHDMQADYSWRASAREYVKLFAQVQQFQKAASTTILK
jgi:starch synthase